MAIARLDLEYLHLDLAHNHLTDASMKVVGGWGEFVVVVVDVRLRDAGKLGRKTPVS